MTNTAKLRAKLIITGKTQKDIAKCLGISLPSVNAKINNKRFFKPSEINKLCEFLQISSIEERFQIFFTELVDKYLHNEK